MNVAFVKIIFGQLRLKILTIDTAGVRMRMADMAKSS